ncbi:hypothetical protein X943_002859 [Babesia divergens]|uniref:S1 motif domain-containing protein n=1 Tax=Babesia divergens TaxID=32595 RepID=A0AAD9LJD8_BABDI|nr:hypothetical protein X943_002859 [Babesia divergens]
MTVMSSGNTVNEYLEALLLGMHSVNQLAFVEAFHGRYSAQVGDVVVGIVQKIAGNCWLIEIGSSERVQLSIFQVNTDGLANRRKLDEDLYEMKNIFNIDDVISCEVQRLSANGTVMLQTRTTKYGRLSNGVLVNVKPTLMLRQSKHIHDLVCGVRMILGCNGFIWLAPSEEVVAPVNKTEVFHNICTLRTIILSLAEANIKINHSIIMEMFEFFKRHFPREGCLQKHQAPQLLMSFLENRTGMAISIDSTH